MEDFTIDKSYFGSRSWIQILSLVEQLPEEEGINSTLDSPGTLTLFAFLNPLNLVSKRSSHLFSKDSFKVTISLNQSKNVAMQ